MQTVDVNSFSAGGTSVDRVKTFRNAQNHTRFVKLMRIVLPVTAIFTLGLYYLPTKFSVEIELDKEKKIGVEDVKVSAKQIRAEGLNYSDGRFSVKAEHSLQQRKALHIMRLHNITARANNKERGWVHMDAVTGLFDSKKNYLLLEKKIDIKTDSGVTARLTTAHVNMKSQVVTSSQPVTVSMPSGKVYAEKMTFFSKSDLITFKQNVRVHLENKPSTSSNGKKSGGIGAMMKGSKDPIKVTSQTLDINHKKQIALFKGQVLAMQAGLAMQSDLLKVDYQSDNKQQQTKTSLPGGGQQVKQIIAESNVVITTTEGQQAKAHRTIFDNDKQLVTLSGNVIIEQGDNILTGEQMVIDMVNQHSYFPPSAGRVKGVFKPKDSGRKKPSAARNSNGTDTFGQNLSGFTAQNGDPLNIAADSLKIFDKQKYAIFEGKVEVLRGQHKMRSGKMRIDYYGNASVSGQKTKGKKQTGAQIKKILATKRVFITTPENQVLSGDRAIFDVKANIVTVDGNVAISQDENISKGEKVVIDLNTGQYRLDAAKGPVTIMINPGNVKLPGQ